MSSIVHSSIVEHYCSKFLLLNCQLNSTKQAFSKHLHMNSIYFFLAQKVPFIRIESQVQDNFSPGPFTFQTFNCHQRTAGPLTQFLN